MSKAIIIIDFVVAPTQIMISGPRATLGNEFKIVKYGSKTSDMNLFHQRTDAIKKPKSDAIKKLINVSDKVTHI